MKDAKTITEFVKNVCFHYSICYSAYFFDYDENDQLVPTPIFEDDLVTPGKLNYLSKLLGMSTEDIANADNKASMRIFNKYPFFKLLLAYEERKNMAKFSLDSENIPIAERRLLYRIFGEENLDPKYSDEDVLQRLINQLKEYDSIVPGTYHPNGEITRFIEYGIDREDYATREEYLEAVREARYGWRDEVEVRIELGLDPYDYETEEEYNEAFEEAEEKYGWRTYATGGFDYGISALDFETEDDYYAAVDEARNAWKSEVEDGSEYYLDPEDFETKEEYLEALTEAKYGWRKSAEDGSLYGFTPDAFETAAEYEDALEEAKTKIANLSIDITVLSALASDNCESSDVKKTNYSYIQIRKNNAKNVIERAEKGEFYGGEEELDRCKFIATSKSIAARYLTTEGVYLYAQAIKDRFKLPFEIPDEKDEIETYFETLLQDLVEDNAEYAMEIWEWCIDTFLPYIQYADYKNDLTHAILLDINNFVDEFPSVIVDYMVNNPNFTSKLILGCTDSLWCIEDFVVIALKGGHTKTAIDIMRCAFSNPHTNVGDKARFISACIDECSNWDEVETIELFREHIFPITFNETDVRITNKIPRWQNAMAEYVESMERDCDKYAYSRVNSWRAQYRNADINPIHYENEDEYLEAVTERKYGWRKHCTNKFGIDPNTFETRAEYDLAISAEYEKERRIRKQERLANAKDSRLYSFCKVSISYPDKPHDYYLTGNVKLHVGDTVIVPFGSDNTEIHATVVAVGECLGANFPCAINRIKQVKEKVENNMEQHSSNKEKTVYCPVKQGQINGIDCLVICDVADRMFRPSVIPEGILWSEEQRLICKQCKYHDDEK